MLAKAVKSEGNPPVNLFLAASKAYKFGCGSVAGLKVPVSRFPSTKRAPSDDSAESCEGMLPVSEFRPSMAY